jgi:endo-alpha-1,4-polygalactosaminidase (GH114 family)
MEKFKVKTRYIDYCVEEEDVCSEFDNDASIEEDSEEYYQAINDKIKEIKDNLPQHMLINVECDKEDLDEMVCDEITNRTGWLIYGFDYDIIG